MDEWINKIWYFHTTEYYLVLQSNEIWTYATIRMNLEDIMRSEISQTQKDNYCMILLYEARRAVKSAETVKSGGYWGVG